MEVYVTTWEPITTIYNQHSALAHDRRGWQFFRRDGRFTTLSDLSKCVVRHVIISTELSLGRPVFIESEWMHGPGMRYGYGRPGHLSLHRVVRWSCTVPALLPPGQVRTKTLSPESAIRGERIATRALMDSQHSYNPSRRHSCNSVGRHYRAAHACPSN